MGWVYLVFVRRFLLFQGEEIGEWVTVSRKIPLSDALSLRSRRSGTKFAVSLFAKLLIKYQRLPRVCQGYIFGKPLLSGLFWELKDWICVLCSIYLSRYNLIVINEIYLFSKAVYKLAKTKKYSERRPLEDVGT